MMNKSHRFIIINDKKLRHGGQSHKCDDTKTDAAAAGGYDNGVATFGHAWSGR